MARPRTPPAKAKAEGRDVENPGRFKGRGDPKSAPLGKPPSWMTGKQPAAWDSFKREIPWLAESDRALVEIAAVTRARLMDGEDVGVQALNLLRQCVGQMGGTPADRSKVQVPDDGEEDPADRFFN